MKVCAEGIDEISILRQRFRFFYSGTVIQDMSQKFCDDNRFFVFIGLIYRFFAILKIQGVYRNYKTLFVDSVHADVWEKCKKHRACFSVIKTSLIILDAQSRKHCGIRYGEGFIAILRRTFYYNVKSRFLT